jgi:hypothetical protein
LIPISLPSRGVSGALPLLESPVELAGLSLRIANGLLIFELTIAEEALELGLEDEVIVVGGGAWCVGTGIIGNIVELLCLGCCCIAIVAPTALNAFVLLPSFGFALTLLLLLLLFHWLLPPLPLVFEVEVEVDNDAGINVLLLFLPFAPVLTLRLAFALFPPDPTELALAFTLANAATDPTDSLLPPPPATLPPLALLAPLTLLPALPRYCCCCCRTKSKSGLLGTCGLDVTLNEGKGVLCLIGIGVILSKLFSSTFAVSASPSAAAGPDEEGC